MVSVRVTVFPVNLALLANTAPSVATSYLATARPVEPALLGSSVMVARVWMKARASFALPVPMVSTGRTVAGQIQAVVQYVQIAPSATTDPAVPILASECVSHATAARMEHIGLVAAAEAKESASLVIPVMKDRCGLSAVI